MKREIRPEGCSIYNVTRVVKKLCPARLRYNEGTTRERNYPEIDVPAEITAAVLLAS